jgi:hypothetical protein
MKRDSLWFGLFLLSILCAATLFVPTAVSAQDSLTPLPDPEISLISANLLVLPIDILDPATIPSGMSPEQAAAYTQQLTHQMTQPLLAKLQRMQAEGLITSFAVRVDLHALTVTGISEQGIESISGLRQVSTVMPYENEMPVCASVAAKALFEKVFALSQMDAQRAQRYQLAPAGLQATDPTIEIYAPPGSMWTDVQGNTTSNTPVTLRILRGGQEIGAGSTTSNNDGRYNFSPAWQSCPDPGYSWTLRPGDVVEVSANGKTVSSVVASLSAWIDPIANTVAGRTDPQRTIEVSLYIPSINECSDHQFYHQNSSVTENGFFSVNMGEQVDFDRRSSAYINARDANGNTTFAWFSAHRISAALNQANFSGYLKPDADFTARLSRNGDLLSTYDGTTTANGHFYGQFDSDVQAGDMIKVESGDISIEYIATAVSLTLDPAGDRIVGVTTPGHRIEVNFFKNNSPWDIPSTCSWAYYCGVTIANDNGGFEIVANLDLMPGDYVDLHSYDAEGNHQYSGHRHVRAIMADLTWNTIQGFWDDPDTSSLAVILKDSGGAVKWSEPSVSINSWNGGFYTQASLPLSPGDSIEAGNGVYTETMTIQPLTAQLGGGSGHLSGTGANGRLLAWLSDFRSEFGFHWRQCTEADTATGDYTLTFDNGDVGAQDSAIVWNIGPDGHSTKRSVHAFSVNMNKADNYVWGYSRQPNSEILITLWRSGEPLAAHRATSSNTGYYYAYLNSGTTDTIMQGDTLQVQTEDGDDTSILIPELTVAIDADNNQIYGRAPAGQVVHLRSLRHLNSIGFYLIQTATTDGSGNYRADFDYQSWFFNCRTVAPGHHCSQAGISYYNEDAHQIRLEGPYPQPVEADSHEGDNTAATARAYTGVRSHTFHASDDVDWVFFNVPAADILNGVAYRIETFNLGWNMATRAELFDANMTLLGQWTGYEQTGRGVSALWAPSSSGKYYLRLSPPDAIYTAYCDARFDLSILPVRAELFLPMVGY